MRTAEESKKTGLHHATSDVKLRIAETQASLPQTPHDNNIPAINTSSESEHPQSSSSAIANAFEVDLDGLVEHHHDKVDKLTEMR